MRRNIIANICAALAISSLAALAQETATTTGESGDKDASGAVRRIDAHVKEVEAKLPQLKRHEVTLDADAIAKVTDEKWSKIHVYSEDGKVVRLKVYPSTGEKTEEFYYDDDGLTIRLS